MRTETQIAASSADRAISAQELAGAKLTVIEGESTDHWQALLEACHREFQPRIRAPGLRVPTRLRSPGARPNMRFMDRYETRIRRSSERVSENLYQLRAPKNRKFPNEPKNSGE